MSNASNFRRPAFKNRTWNVRLVCKSRRVKRTPRNQTRMINAMRCLEGTRNTNTLRKEARATRTKSPAIKQYICQCANESPPSNIADLSSSIVDL